MTDQKQAPERITLMRRIGETEYHVPKPGESMSWGNVDRANYIRKDIHDAAIKQRDELAAERDNLIRVNHRQATCIHSCGAYIGPETACTIEGLPKAVKRVVAERDQALAASAAREIAMRTRAAEMVKKHLGPNPYCQADILALSLSPDGYQQALNDVRATAWDAGWMCRYNGGHYSDNPHRKPSDAGKSEDRG